MKQMTFWDGIKTLYPLPRKKAVRRIRQDKILYSLPPHDTPRARLCDMGPDALSDVELLSLVLGGRPEEALDRARALLARYGDLPSLLRTSITELSQIEGIGPAGAARIRAALELGRRAALAPGPYRRQIWGPDDAARSLQVEMGHLEQEQVRVLLLDVRHRLIREVVVYQGSVSSAQVRIGELFREAVRENCSAVIVVHNHPSGDPTPSPEDEAITREIVQAGKLLSIEVVDHLVVARQGWVSMRERKIGFN